MIFISDTNKISFKLGLGRATNSKAELSALWATLKLAKDKHLPKLNIYGDSKAVIEWAQGRNDIRAPHLQNLLRAIQSLQHSFEATHISHIYREYNIEADSMSKQALAIQPGIIEGEIFGEDDPIQLFIPL